MKKIRPLKLYSGFDIVTVLTIFVFSTTIDILLEYRYVGSEEWEEFLSE